MSVEAADAEEDGPVLIGEVLANRYQIVSHIGEGAMGTVFKAKHVKVGRPFAVKVLHKRLVADGKVLQRFEREAELAGRLRHPNVVGVVDVGETTDGFRYMVMDFAEGSDLATLLNEAPMPPERIINMVRQMLEGLYHAHEQGLIHRDFKPENVIIERDDHDVEVPRIVDFGIAILREGSGDASSAGRLTTNGLVLGTPHYMAPEQAVADPIDHRIDLFALGIVIYEMLCGKLPFDGTGAEVARANLLLDPPLIAQRVPYLEVDPLLEAFSRRLMAKKREMRPATAKAARELLDLITSDPASAAAALGVPVGAASARAPAITQPVSPQRDAVREDAEFDPVESRTPVPPTPLLYGRAPTPTPFAATEAELTRAPTPLPVKLEAPAYVTPSSFDAPVVPTTRSQEHIRTDSATALDWERTQRSKRTLVFIVGGALALAAIITVVATRGDSSERPAEPDKVVVRATTPDPKPETPKVDPPAKPEVQNVDPPVQKADPDPVVDPKKSTPRPGVKKPDPKKSPDPKQAAPDVKPTLPDDPKTVPKPAKTVIDTPALYVLYGAVGKELAAASKIHGEDAVAPARNKFRLIQIQDATSSEAKREWAGDLLLQARAHLGALKKP